MSVIFGVCHFGEQVTNADELRAMADRTARYGPDGSEFYIEGRAGFGRQAYHTDTPANRDAGIVTDRSGNVLAFDGRLDNIIELCRDVNLTDCEYSDSSVALAAFEQWGTDCFAHLIGEWALALWSAKDESIILATDHAGTKTLYYSVANGSITWSTYLETLVYESARQKPNCEYVTRYLLGWPLANLTGFENVLSVEPAHYDVIGKLSRRSRLYWRCSDRPVLRLKSDHDYVEGFLAYFGNAVTRRDGDGPPVIAHLSGGMDSTAIVCMSDRLRLAKGVSIPRLATLSFYNESEPNWNERPYFSLVEANRGKEGIHLSLDNVENDFVNIGASRGRYLIPGAHNTTTEIESLMESAIGVHGYRVILSGIGGDEVLGGHPDPLPELASLIAAGSYKESMSKAVEWSLANRTTLFDLLSRAFRLQSLARVDPAQLLLKTPTPPWLCTPTEIRHNVRAADNEYLKGETNNTPQDIVNRLSWRAAISTLPSHAPSYLRRYEYRYPFLDRDLVEYLFRIPQDQLARPGRRRYLMRQALVGIVPREILERKRKAFVVRGPLLALRRAWEDDNPILKLRTLSEFGLVDASAFRSVVDRTARGEDQKWMPAIVRTVHIESWLQQWFVGEAASPQVQHWLTSAKGTRKSAVVH